MVLASERATERSVDGGAGSRIDEVVLVIAGVSIAFSTAPQEPQDSGGASLSTTTLSTCPDEVVSK